MKRFAPLFLVSALISLLLPLPTHAATGEDALRLITAPAPIDLVGKPGQTVTTVLRVKNGGTKDELIAVSALPFGAYQTSGQPQLRDPGPGDSYLKWATFSPAVFTAPVNAWMEITVTISIPPEAAFGYYYAMIFSRANPAQDVSGTKTGLLGGSAILVLLDVDVPGAKRTVAVNSFTTGSGWSEFLPITFNVSLKNTGNVHAAPRGNIFLERGSQKDIAILEVNSEQGNILPGTDRTFSVDWTDGTPHFTDKVVDGNVVHASNGLPEQTLVWKGLDLSKLRMGHYTATLVMTYDDGTKDVPLEAKVSFWVIPWRLIVGVILIPLIPALLVFFLMRRRYRRA